MIFFHVCEINSFIHADSFFQKNLELRNMIFHFIEKKTTRMCTKSSPLKSLNKYIKTHVYIHAIHKTAITSYNFRGCTTLIINILPFDFLILPSFDCLIIFLFFPIFLFYFKKSVLHHHMF
jgi:hypothetical protein